MKKFIFCFVFAFACIFATSVAFAADEAKKDASKEQVAEKNTEKEKTVEEDKPGQHCPFVCVMRGFCNITTGVLEVPRCMIYDNSFIPVLGLVVGAPEGACFTVARIFTGLYDLFTLGYSNDTCHGKVFPDTVFQAKWVYKKSND